MIEIGKIIQKVIKEKRVPVTEFAQKISTNRNNVYNIFRRETIDLKLLLKIGEVLDHDFIQYYITDSTRLAIIRNKNNENIINEEIVLLQKQVKALENEVKELRDRLKDKEMIIELLESKIK